jgi:hypothetical protein
LGGGGWLVYQYLRSNAAFAASLGEFLSSGTFTILGVTGIVLVIIVIALTRVFRGTILGQLLGRLSAVMVGVGIIVFLLWITFLNPHIGMTRTGFTTSYVSIFTSNKVTFENPANGVTQILCIGSNQQCEPAATAGGPAQLDQGLVIRPGQSVNVEFDDSGDYYITSKNTPHMNLKVTVNEIDDGGGD